ncbi:MAG: stage III sporulation protein AD [Clostridium sp.]
MEIGQVVVIGIVATVIVVFLKDQRPEMALQLSLAAGIIMFLFMMTKLTVVVQALQQISQRVNIDMAYLNIVLKIIGVAYLASFGVEICKDAGQSSIAAKIEFAGKIIIISLSIPILMAVMDLVVKILP